MRKFLSSLIILLLFLFIGCGKSFKTTRVHQTSDRILMAESGGSDDTHTLELEVGLHLIRQGEMDSAVTFFQLNIFSNPGSWQGYYYLGLIHNQTGRFKSAVEYFHQSLEKVKADNNARSLIYTGMGESCRLLGKIGQARLNYHTALNLNSNCREARDGLALLNLRSGP